jgi:hypothetical protein
MWSMGETADAGFCLDAALKGACSKNSIQKIFFLAT